MNTEKTPLVQKLILGALTLILVCLIVLIAQNRAKDTVSVSEVNTTAEPGSPPSVNNAEPPQVASSKQTTARPPVPQVPPALRERSMAAGAQPTPEPARIQTLPPPQPYTTLVNPVGREPLDMVLQPHAPVLKTEICGRVRLEGTPPPEIPITMNAACSRLHEGHLITRHYVVGPERGLAHVLVYIKGSLPKKYYPSPRTAPIISVSGCLFEPYVLGMHTDQKLTIQNFDNMLHNFHATSRSNREFNVSLSFRGQATQKDFEKPEIFVRMKCDVHPWEFSYVGVVEHPFFAVTDTNGVFCLPAGLPHGRYTLAAAHVKAGETTQEILVQDEPAYPIEFALNVPRR